MKASPKTTMAERAGRTLGRAYRAAMRREAHVVRWLVGKGLPSRGAKAILWIIKLAVLAVLLYVAFWLALLLIFAIGAAWIARNADFSGISSALARSLTGLGVIVSLGARNVEKLATLVQETGARPFTVDASQADSVATLFDRVSADTGDPEIVIFNAAASLHGPLAELDPIGVQWSIATTAFGGFLAAHHAARTMVPRGRGAILFSGNTASIKGFANSAAFAMGKFALRGLAQSAARELQPKGIHVAHFVIDGFIRSERHPDPEEAPDSTLDPEAIAQTYIDILCQPRSAWTCEVELRPWVERF